MKYFTFIVLLFVAVSCTVKPEPINFGKDQCHFCKMNIVDKQHASQLVTQKGKQYKYDAIECMLNELSKNEKLSNISVYLISDFGKSKMIDATQASFLISPEIKSPMGDFLSGFSSLESAKEAQKEYGGKIYSWKEIKNKYTVK